jgi:hypothetical protein
MFARLTAVACCLSLETVRFGSDGMGGPGLGAVTTRVPAGADESLLVH